MRQSSNILNLNNIIGSQHGESHRLYRYDPVDNLIERKTTDGQVLTLAYDGAHRLTHLQRSNPSGETLEARYQYDGLSRRILKQVRQNGEETTAWYGWDGDRQCAEATDVRLRTTVHEPNSFVPLLRLEQWPRKKTR